ncbi:uncharacterized protein G2W53_027616 [Senna tora]|uniref:Uncharacterized protein n=1 Tax=Senna tora TaxID=362788 RepID=A0A834TJU0_9FABA|nr:uncharacterized protein G2W53_027616 [Senna tora]
MTPKLGTWAPPSDSRQQVEVKGEQLEPWR